MTHHFLISFCLLALAAIASWIAYRRGFFNYPQDLRLQSGITIWTLCIAVLLYFGLQLGLGVGGFAFFRPTSLQGIGYLQITTLGIAALSLLAYRGRAFLKRPLNPHVKIGALCFLLAFPLANGLGQFTEGILTVTVGPMEKEQAVVAFLRKLRAFPLLFSLSMVMTVIVVPLAEEILFRGLFQGWLRKRMRALYAILLSAALFTLVHLAPSQGWTNLTLLTVLFPLALCLGYLYERQRSLWAPVTLHAVFNGVTMIGVLAGA